MSLVTCVNRLSALAIGQMRRNRRPDVRTKDFLQTVLLPPVNCFVLVFDRCMATFLSIGRVLIWMAGLVFLVSSLPVFGLMLMDAGSRRMACRMMPSLISLSVVLLPGGLYANAAEYDGRDRRQPIRWCAGAMRHGCIVATACQSWLLEKGSQCADRSHYCGRAPVRRVYVPCAGSSNVAGTRLSAVVRRKP